MKADKLTEHLIENGLRPYAAINSFKANEHKMNGGYLFIVADCMHFKTREDESIGRIKACMIACGVNGTEKRKTLSVRVGDSKLESILSVLAKQKLTSCKIKFAANCGLDPHEQ